MGRNIIGDQGMLTKIFSLLCFCFPFLLITPSAIAQPEYVMQNAMVEDCEGILTDSENGPEEGQYNHNEDYTFTVCVDQADEIIIAFNFFSTEETYDILYVYDGPNSASPLLAMLTGSIQPPPVLVATSGCVTFHFISDANIVAAGWELNWTVEIGEPTPPRIDLVSMLECPMSAITFHFDIPVDCDMMSANQFTIIGPGSPSIAQINPLDCMPGELGQTFEVIFASPLAQPGTYRLLFNGSIQDACGEWHDVSANIAFDLMNCPFSSFIELVTAACEGDCGVVSASIIGGDIGASYDYAWGHTPINQAAVNICVDIPTLVSVTVTDLANMITTVAQYNYIPLENPVILNPIQDTICSSMGDHIYQSNLPGGLYYSSIIPDWLRAEGRYQFWRWSYNNVLNTDLVTYVAPNGCVAYDTVYALPVNPGSIEAACVNGGDFTVNGGTPIGGVWQGPSITTLGVFSPTTPGSFVVNYTAPNGCIGNKRINVQNSIIMPTVDTICSSQEFDLVADPFGGVWSGSGIVNSILGRIRPWQVATNQTYQYIYILHGCSDTMEVYIQELWAGPDLEVCDEDSLLLLPYTGTWTGPGIYLPVLNAFDISMLGPGEYDYHLSAFGCTDEFRLYISAPYADPKEPITFCLEDQWFLLSDFVNFAPNWGDFTGPATVESNDVWYFNPQIAGAGMHTIVFDALGCKDSFNIEVEPFAEITDYSFCELSPAQILSASPPGGTWSGPGFLDGVIGLFDPQLLSPGSYPILYTAPSGCVTSDTIEIILWEQVSISGVDQLYCFSDTLINVVVAPGDGTFFINGLPLDPEFNPSELGTGTHELYYTRGSGPCASDKRIFFSVTPQINGLTSLPDSICIGENAVIDVNASGGNGTLSATWDQGLGFGSSHIVNPILNTNYIVTVTDGCSDPFIGTASIHVHQPFQIDVLTGPAVCYDDTSSIEIVPPIPGPYAVYWLLDSIFESFYLEGKPGIYEAEVIDLLSGCSQSYELQIPGPPPLSSNFTIIPNQLCIDVIDNTIQVIDLATGFTDGWIDFGDGTGPIPYVQGEFIQHDYIHFGDFQITLIVTNELGCRDTLTRNICVENRVELFLPNAFSPNGDGNNDVLTIETYGVTDIQWEVFTRWGEKVFGTNDGEAYWDGTHHGQHLNPGAYVLRVTYKDLETGVAGEKISTVTLLR